MKKLLTLVLVFISYISFAQTATDENGNKVYKGSSIAVFSRISSYAVDGDFADIKRIMPEEREEELRIVFNTMATSAIQNQGIRVVNRDNNTYKRTQQLIDESRNEEYLDGISIQAKNIGATHFLIQDITFYTYKNDCIIIEIMYNVICVETNVSSRNIRRYKIDAFEYNKDIQSMISQEKEYIRKYFMDAFPAFFVLQKASGTTAILAATSAFGIDTNDKVYFYNWENVSLPFRGKKNNYSKMELVSVGSNPKLANGHLQVKLDKKLSSINNLVIKLGDCLHSEINTYCHTPVAFMDLKLSGRNSMDDYCKKQINNAVYNALHDYAAINLIEYDELTFIKAERELQKSEEFIDGSVIEQFKASGAQYILNITNFLQQKEIVTFKLSVIDVSTNAIEKDFLINCHISNIDKIIKYYINLVFVSPISIGNYSNKQIYVYPLLPIASNEGEQFSILYNKPMTNPMTGKTVYNRVEIAKCTLTHWNIQEYIMTITKITSKEDFNAIGNMKDSGLFFLQKDIKQPEDIMKNNSEFNWENRE